MWSREPLHTAGPASMVFERWTAHERSQRLLLSPFSASWYPKTKKARHETTMHRRSCAFQSNLSTLKHAHADASVSCQVNWFWEMHDRSREITFFKSAHIQDPNPTSDHPRPKQKILQLVVMDQRVHPSYASIAARCLPQALDFHSSFGSTPLGHPCHGLPILFMGPAAS